MFEWSRIPRVGRFVLIGTLNALITAVVIYVMMELIGLDYKPSNVVAYLVAQIHNFLWCKYWVFSTGEGQVGVEIPLFLLAVAVAYGVQAGSVLLLVELCGMHPYVAQFIGLLLYGAVNYLMNRRVTFRSKTPC